MSATSVTTSSLNRFQKNDNIFVNIGKISHPAIFIEYYNEDHSQARIQYTSSSLIDTVQLSQLELMDNTTKRHRIPAQKIANDDNKTTNPNQPLKCRTPPTAPATGKHRAEKGTVAKRRANHPLLSTAKSFQTSPPTITAVTDNGGKKLALPANAVTDANVQPSLTLPQPSNMGNHSTFATTTTAAAASRQEIITPTTDFQTYNGGRYRLSHYSQNNQRWICNKFQVQFRDQPPSSYENTTNDLQNIRRRTLNYNSLDWTFTRCSGAFNVDPNGKTEFVTLHNCSSTFQIDDAPDERPLYMTMSPPKTSGIGTYTSIDDMKNIIMLEDRSIWKPVFGGQNQRFHTPNLMAFPTLYTKVKQYMSWYVKRVQKIYPSLIHVKYSIILSNPSAPAQTLHFDYPDSVMNKDPERQPISLIVALDPFMLNIVTKREGTTPTTMFKFIEPGNCIFFTNKLEHGGAKNNYMWNGKPCEAIRLFTYMVSDENDFPPDTVQYFTDERKKKSTKK